MKNLRFVSILFWFCLPACAQSRLAQNAYVFVQHKNFGTIAVDRNGKPLTPGAETTLYIYFEADQKNAPKINEVIYYNNIYKNPEVFLAGKKNIDVGNRMVDGKRILLNPKNGNSLWRLEIIIENNLENVERLPQENSKDVSLVTDHSNKVIIKGTKNKKPFVITANTQTDLKPIMGL